MYMDILRAIAGIEIFPVVSLLLFVTVFTVVLVWTLRLDRARAGTRRRCRSTAPRRPRRGGHDGLQGAR